MKSIFVSYRRSDASDVTGRIFGQLKEAIGEEHLFKDVEGIPLGQDYRGVIVEAIGQCRVLLAIIGDDWLDVTDASGNRRIDDPTDSVNFEIATALQRGIPVIPLLVQGATIPDVADLPEQLKELKYCNGIPIRPDPDFENDMERLCEQLHEYVDDDDRSARRNDSRWFKYAAIAAVAALLVVATYFATGAAGDSDTTTDQLVKYRVSIFTKVLADGEESKGKEGTDASLEMTISGDQDIATIEKKTFDPKNKDNFEPGPDPDVFDVELADVGDIKRIELHLDVSPTNAKGCDWFLDRIEIENKATTRKWIFPHDNWIKFDVGLMNLGSDHKDVTLKPETP